MLETQKQNLNLIAQAAVASEKATQCPAELQAAQCILETGWLSHAPGNNCFGIKSFQGESGRQLLNTREWFTDAECQGFLASADGRTANLVQPVEQDSCGRKLHLVQDWFATFPTLGHCFTHRAAIWNQGRYAPAASAYLQNQNLDALVHAIAPIYATDPNYADRILSLVRNPDVQAAIAQARGEVSS